MDRPTSDEASFLASNVLSQIAYRAAAASETAHDQNIVAALFSAAWLEAGTNELLHHIMTGSTEDIPAGFRQARLAAVAAGIHNSMAPLANKLRVLYTSMRSAELPEDRRPWRDAFLLMEVRNWLVHLKPEVLKVREGREDEPMSIVSRQVHKLVKSLETVGAIRMLPQGSLVPVVLAANLPGVGPWSYRTTYSALEELAVLFPEWQGRLMNSHLEPSALPISART